MSDQPPFQQGDKTRIYFNAVQHRWGCFELNGPLSGSVLLIRGGLHFSTKSALKIMSVAFWAVKPMPVGLWKL